MQEQLSSKGKLCSQYISGGTIFTLKKNGLHFHFAFALLTVSLLQTEMVVEFLHTSWCLHCNLQQLWQPKQSQFWCNIKCLFVTSITLRLPQPSATTCQLVRKYKFFSCDLVVARSLLTDLSGCDWGYLHQSSLQCSENVNIIINREEKCWDPGHADCNNDLFASALSNWPYIFIFISLWLDKKNRKSISWALSTWLLVVKHKNTR